MALVKSLGYLGFTTTDVDAWRSWAVDVVGLQDVTWGTGTAEGGLRLRMDDLAWRFDVRPGPDGLAFTGWDVADNANLEQLANRLADGGVDVTDEPGTACDRQVERLVSCVDPDGYRLEFHWGPLVPAEPFVSPSGACFVTGPLGLGHILQTVADTAAARRFYVELLGFGMSDIIHVGSTPVHFLHVNARHHSLAFAQVSDRQPALGHFMVELVDLDAVGRALDRVHAGSARLTETLGRHTNDHMISFYMMNPSGSQTEIGWGGRRLDELWTPRHYTATALWGHKVPGSEYTDAGPVSPREHGELA